MATHNRLKWMPILPARRAAALIVWCCGMLMWTFRVHATGPPDNPVAYYRLDPTRFEPGGHLAVVPFALQLAERSGAIGEDVRPFFDGLLAASVIGGVPHSITVLDLDAELDAVEPNGFRIAALRAVLALETPRDHRSYLQTLGTILSHHGEGEGEAEARQEMFDLPGGRRAVRFAALQWPTWQAVEWASLTDAFVVGLGRGSVEAWIAAREAASGPSLGALDLHRKRLNAPPDPVARDGRRAAPSRPPGRDLMEDGSAIHPSAPAAESFAEIWINLDRLHETMPEVLAQGRGRDWLLAWDLDNARDWMFHGRWREEVQAREGDAAGAPRDDQALLLFDITWRRRSEKRDVVARRALTLDRWPADELRMPKPRGRYLVVIPADFGAGFDRVLDALGAAMKPPERASLDARRRRYESKRRGAFDAMWRAFKPYVVLSADPPPALPVPGATTVFVELRDEPAIDAVQKRIDALLMLFLGENDERKPGRDGPSLPIQHDAENDLYWLRHDDAPMFRVPAWGWVDRTLVIGWDPSVIMSHHQRAAPNDDH